MVKISRKFTIRQLYDIAKAIISDPSFNATKEGSAIFTKYIFKKRGLCMEICVSHGGKEWDGDYDMWDNKEGVITIEDENGSVCAKTKHNVGRAMNCLSINPIAVFTRLRAPLFFRLINMAEKRGIDQTKFIKSRISDLRTNIR